MTQKQKLGKREEYIIKVGPLMIKALEQQKKKIADVTYNVCKSSFYEAGEILAKKILGLI